MTALPDAVSASCWANTVTRRSAFQSAAVNTKPAFGLKESAAGIKASGVTPGMTTTSKPGSGAVWRPMA